MKKYIKYIKPLMIGLALVGYAASPYLLVAACGALAAYYYGGSLRPGGWQAASQPTATASPPLRRLIDIVIEKTSGMSAAVAVVGILFYLQRWNGAYLILLVGGGTLALTTLLTLLRYGTTRDLHLQVKLLRGVVVGGASAGAGFANAIYTYPCDTGSAAPPPPGAVTKRADQRKQAAPQRRRLAENRRLRLKGRPAQGRPPTGAIEAERAKRPPPYGRAGTNTTALVAKNASLG